MLLSRRIAAPLISFIRHFQVTVLGATSEIGQTICLLLRAQPTVTKLVIHDYFQEAKGVVLDVSHIPAGSALVGYFGEDTLDIAIKNSDLVIAAGGVIEKPGCTKNMCFESNTDFIKSIATKIAKTVPMPFVGIVTEPINSIVPMAAEVMRNHGDCDGQKLFGVTTIDLLRTQCLYAMENGLKPHDCFIPVIGGHSKKTMVPLLTQAKPSHKMDEKQTREFTTKVRKGDEAVTKAKKGCSPTLSVAYSTLVFVRGIINALEGRPSKVNAFVENNDFGTSFFSGLVEVTENGAGEMQRYNNLSTYECNLLEGTIEQLRKDISKGRKILELTSNE